MRQQHHVHHAESEWLRASSLKSRFGISPSQMRRYTEEGLVASSLILRPGQRRGVRLYRLADVLALIERGRDAGAEQS